MLEFEPIREWLKPAWECFRVLRQLSGPEEGISTADVVAYFDLAGIKDPQERRSIYRHLIALEGERKTYLNEQRGD